MEAIPDKLCNEHDYTLKFEVPLDAIKTEIIEEHESSNMSSQLDVTRVPIVLRDNKPKLRRKKQTLHVPAQKQSLLLPKPPSNMTQRPIVPKPPLISGVPINLKSDCLSNKAGLPRPIMPKIDLPPPLPPNFKGEPPPNCKGVLVVQDVKVCTMYVPKNGNGGAPDKAFPIHSFPMNALQNGVLNASTGQSVLIPPGGPGQVVNTVEPVQEKALPKRTEKYSSKEQSFTIMAPSSNIAPNNKCPFYGLLQNVQNILAGTLPLYWFSIVEGEGITVMLMSFGKEKAIQRRVYVSYGGNVEISVHCAPLPKFFVRDIVTKAGTQIRLTNTTVKKFSEWVLAVVHVLRDFHTCTGLEHPDNRDLYMKAKDIVFDENPYQECRYNETFRSINCLKLVTSGKRRCMECSKSFSWARKRTIQDCVEKEKKKLAVDSDQDGPKSQVSVAVEAKETAFASTEADDCNNMSMNDVPEIDPNSSNIIESKNQNASKRKSVLRLRATTE